MVSQPAGNRRDDNAQYDLPTGEWGFPIAKIGPFKQYKVEMIIQPLELNPDDKMDMLSGGQLRRASLAGNS